MNKIFYGNELSTLRYFFDIEKIDPGELKILSYKNNLEEIFDLISEVNLFGETTFLIENAEFLLIKKNMELIKKILDTNQKVYFLLIAKKDQIPEWILNHEFVETKYLTTYEKDKMGWIKNELQSLEILDKLNFKQINLISNLMPLNALIIHQELTKLKIACLDKKITNDDLYLYLNDYSNNDVFSISRLIALKEISLLNNLINNLLSRNKQVAELISLISNEFIQLKMIYLALNEYKNNTKACSELKMNQFIFNKKTSLMRMFKIEQINWILNELYSLDEKIKKGLIDPIIGFKYFITNICK